MSNIVSVNFRNYLRRIRKQSKTTVRELASAIGKSPGYITQLEKGYIKKIPYDTATAIFKYLNDKSCLLVDRANCSGEIDIKIHELLMDSFSIYPKDYWEERLKEQEEKQKAEFEYFTEFNKRVDKLIANLTHEHDYFLEFALKFISKRKGGNAYLKFVLELLELDLDLSGEVDLQGDLRDIIKKYQKRE